MRRMFALLLALAMLATLLSGCGSTSSAPTASAPAEESAAAPAEDAPAEQAPEEPETPEEADTAGELHTEVYGIVEAEPLEGEVSTRTDPEYAELYEAWKEAAALFMDWFYTDEGIMTSNYGPEGESWYWTPEGEIVFTDLI